MPPILIHRSPPSPSPLPCAPPLSYLPGYLSKTHALVAQPPMKQETVENSKKGGLFGFAALRARAKRSRGEAVKNAVLVEQPRADVKERRHMVEVVNLASARKG